MKITNEALQYCKTYKFKAMEDEKEIGRAYLHVIYNDSEDISYGLLADVKVNEKYQKHGIGTKLVEDIIKKAKDVKCKWLFGTSRYTRPHVHQWYKKLGFSDRGKSFRIDFD